MKNFKFKILSLWDISQRETNFKKAFTMVELLVAMSLFIIFMVIISGSFVRALRTQRAIVALIAANDNASLIIEQIAREIRTGSNFSLSGNDLTFINASNAEVTYRLNTSTNAIEKKEGVDFESITATNVKINNLNFYLYGQLAGDGYPPRITISLNVSPNIPTIQNISTNFQTTVSARNLVASGSVTTSNIYDVMLILDRSNTIDNPEIAQLKTASRAFVDTLSPSTNGSHIGLITFATHATLDQHLSSNSEEIKNNIDAISQAGSPLARTNLSEGINLAIDEFDDSNEYERPEINDLMIIISDGDPNEPGGETNARAVAAAAADEARSKNIEVYVVGVGVGPSTEIFLIDEIANDSSYYFSVTDYSGLEAILQTFAQTISSRKREVLPL